MTGDFIPAGGTQVHNWGKPDDIVLAGESKGIHTFHFVYRQPLGIRLMLQVQFNEDLLRTLHLLTKRMLRS